MNQIHLIYLPLLRALAAAILLLGGGCMGRPQCETEHRHPLHR